MPIPNNILSVIRDSGNQVTIPTYNYWMPQIVASGVVNVTQVAYPIGALPITWNVGSYLLIETGQLWTLTSGTGENKRIISYGVIRKPATSNVAYIDGKSRGDSGIASMQTSGISAGVAFTVYTMKPLWGLISRIKDGQFLKRFDIPYDGSGSNPSPLVNIGSWRQAWSDKDGFAYFNFTTANCFAWGNKSVSSVLWSIPAGGTLTNGTVTSSNITLRLPEGFHIVKCRVTDSGGAIATGTRPVWVNGETFKPLSETYGFNINSDSQDRKGRNQSVSFMGDFMNRDEFLPGTPMLYTEDNYFDGEMLNANVLVDTFVGFVADEQYTHGLINGEKVTNLTLQGTWSCLERIPMVSQAIVEVNSPADWTDIGIGFGIPQFVNWYLLKHHTNYLDLFDYTFYYDINEWTNLPDNERKLNWGMNGGTMSEYLSQTASIIAGSIGTMSDGTLTLQRHPNLMDSDFRDNLDTRMVITVDELSGVCDITNNIEYSQQYSNQTGHLRLFTLSYNGGGEDATNAYGSIAPGYYQMQAQGSSDEDSVIIKPDNGIGVGLIGYRPSNQYRTNELSGHMLAKTNNPTPEISLEFVRNMDIFEPALMLWSDLDVPATWNPRGTPLQMRLLPMSIDRSWEQAGNGYVKNIKVNFETESFGQPGETYTLDIGGGELYEPVIPPIEATQDPDEDTVGDAGVLFAINQNGRLGRSKNGINWQKATGNIISETENVVLKFQDIAFDPFSPYIESGFVTGTMGGWVALCKESVTNNGIFNVLSIYYSDDLLASNIEWTLQYESTEIRDLHEYVRLRSNQQTQGYVACVFHSISGNYCVRTINGESWSKTACGNTLPDLGTYNRRAIDFSFQGNRLITSGFHTISGKYRLGYFNTGVGAWNWVNNSPNSDIPIPSIESSISYTYATFITQSETTNNSIIGQTVYETNPQTFSNILGSRIPFKFPTTTGDWSFDNVKVTVRGDPDNGLRNSETPLVAGYGDPNFSSPSQGICYTTPFDFYAYDDGWLVNADYTNPNFKDAPNKQLKFNITINIRGEITFEQGGMAGKWSFNNTTFSCATLGLLSLIGFHTVSCELYGKNGLLRAEYVAVIQSSGNGWSITAQQPASVTGDGIRYLQQVVLKPAGLDADEHVRKVVLKLRQGTYDNTFVYTTQPICRGWGITSSKMLIETPKFYRITDISASTPNYTDITPSDPDDIEDVYMPTNPYAISIDPVVLSKIDTVAERLVGGDSHLTRTYSRGDAWNVRGNETFLYGLRLSREYGLAWGYNRLLVSIDGFVESSIDAMGDWSTSIDNGGLFRVFRGTLIPEHGV